MPTPETEHTQVHAHSSEKKPAPYMNPYVAGVGLGLVLLASFVIMGRGLGASGAMSSVVAVTVDAVDTEYARGNEFFLGYLENGIGHPLKSWLVFEVLGILVGGFISGILAGRITRTVEKGPRVSVPVRLALATFGGMLMGVGAKLARGCTSGQALSGGALLNVGSWAFMLMVFAAAYGLAYFVRRQWL